jgi:uncharacterized protein (TIGR02284 family)
MKNVSGAVATLASLVQINNRRLSQYKKVADKAKDIEMKLLFMRYAVQAQGFMNLLNRWIIEYGGMPASELEETNLMATWNRIKDTLTSDAQNILLNRCEALELEALRIYRTIVALTILPSPALRDVQNQADELGEACRIMKDLQTRSLTAWQVVSLQH